MRTLVLVFVAISLAACASQTPPPAMTYDQKAFKPAIARHDPKPVGPKIAAGTVIGPVLPSAPAAKPKPVSPIARVAAANRAALQEPAASNYVNAVQIYPYSDNALYRLYAAPLKVTDIALEPGETLSAISAGDTVRWAVGDTSSGNGQTKEVHVLVKPFVAGLKTNLVILTDRRTYHLELVSTERIAMAAVAWRYPDAELVMEKDGAASQSVASANIDSGIALENLNFGYAIAGDNPPWRPVRAFDDGHKVYIEFPEEIERSEAPPLFVAGPGGSNELVNYRVRGNYYIVDRLFAAAELRLGGDRQQVVRITRTDSKKSHEFSALFGG